MASADATTVSLERIKRARAYMAAVVQHHGDKWWPLFDKLDQEYQSRLGRKARLQAALADNGRDQIIGER